MIFTVVYLPSAQNELAETRPMPSIYRDAGISRAANLIDNLLRREPNPEAKRNSCRIISEVSLAVTFV